MFDIFKKLDEINKNKCESVGPVEYIIVGLGNPEADYDNTRHNIGFMTINHIADDLNVQVKKLKFKSLCTTATIDNKKVLLMKPQTFMNNSGEAVVEAMSFYKIPPQHVIIMFDDISLDIGKIRIRRKGSAGGHNGIKNIIYLSGSDMFPRIKIGIGKKPNAKWDLKDWVLSSFTKEEQLALKEPINNAYEAIKLILNDKIDNAMNSYN